MNEETPHTTLAAGLIESLRALQEHNRTIEDRLTSLQETNRRLVAALFPDPVKATLYGFSVSDNARLNLQSFHDYHMRRNPNLEGLGSIRYVIKQLSEAEALLSELEQDKSDDARHP